MRKITLPADLSPYAQKWIAHGLSCEPADKPKAQEGIRMAYEAAGLKPPEIYLWLSSPWAGAIAAALFAQDSGSDTKEEIPHLPEVRTELKRQLEGISGKLADQLRHQLTQHLTRSQISDQIGRACLGQHDASWLAFYATLQEFGVTEADRLNGLMLTAKTMGWWWPFQTFVVCTDRPCVLKRDDRFRLHCEDGPALAYRDGWGVWAWHGVRLTREQIEQPESITLQQIKGEANAEVKRAWREIYGEGRYLLDTGAKLIHADVEGARKGSAPRVLLQDNEQRRFLACTDGSTGRVYYLEVPPETKTCQAAHEALCGFTESLVVNKS